MGNSNNGDGTTMMLVLGGVCCLCIMSSAGMGGLYFFHDPFKKWVNNLFGQGGSGETGRGCRGGFTFGINNRKPYCQNITSGIVYTTSELFGVKDMDGARRGCTKDSAWNSAGDQCCLLSGKGCGSPGIVFKGA